GLVDNQVGALGDDLQLVVGHQRGDLDDHVPDRIEACHLEVHPHEHGGDPRPTGGDPTAYGRRPPEGPQSSSPSSSSDRRLSSTSRRPPSSSCHSSTLASRTAAAPSGTAVTVCPSADGPVSRRSIRRLSGATS